MDIEESQRVCIRVNFRDRFEYCDIDLNNITQASFLLDGMCYSIFDHFVYLLVAHFMYSEQIIEIENFPGVSQLRQSYQKPLVHQNR